MADTLIWDDIALRAALITVEGRDLARRAIAVESAAKVNASGRPGPNVRTGRLRASISWRLGEDYLGLYADIGSNVEYAGYVEEDYSYLEPALSAARS